jgi:predicted nucleotidyltransferase component of viral defense system
MVDRCQVTLLRELTAQHADRLVLKGGMAMRAVFGSLRLTKDIDFDRDETISQKTLEAGLSRSLLRAAQLGRLRDAKADITKSTATTVRARLQGQLDPGVDVRFDVEVSGRGAAPPEYRRTELVVPPAEYSIAPFQVNTYTNEALAAMKVAAALSLQRNAARDLYDLRDLIRAGAHPVAILAKQSEHVLQDYAQRSLGKLEGLTYQLARDELLPYLPPDEREQLTEDAWIETTLHVAQTIEAWCREAMAVHRHQEEDPATEKPK